jgi:hypothetical protein
MKTLKSILLGLSLLVVSVAAKATVNPTPGKLTKTDVLNIFINSSVHGIIAGLDDILAEDVQFNTKRGDQIKTTNKKNMLDYFKANQNVEQQCQFTNTTVEDADDHMIVKLDMKYDGYVLTNVVTITNLGYGWKITKVETSVA